MIYGLDAEPLPDDVTPLEAVAVLKTLDENGEVALWIRTTASLNAWERLGMLELAAYSSKRGLQAGFEADAEDDDDGPR